MVGSLLFFNSLLVLGKDAVIAQHGLLFLYCDFLMPGKITDSDNNIKEMDKALSRPLIATLIKQRHANLLLTAITVLDSK